VQGREPFEKQAAEETRQNAHGEEEAGLAGDPAPAVRRQAAAGNDDVDMWMMGERRAPGVQHGGEADARAEMLRVGGDGDQRLGRRPEQEVVEGGLVWNAMAPIGEPLPRRRALTLRAVTVAAGIVSDALVRAVLTALDMSAERGGATSLDRRHDLQLAEADMAGVGLAPRRAMGAKDVGDLQARPRHAASVRRARIGS
jgi:hypothetical protein